MTKAARTVPIAFACALLLAGCSAPEGTSGPGPETEGEAQALADAEAMLDLRDPPAEEEDPEAEESSAE